MALKSEQAVDGRPHWDEPSTEAGYCNEPLQRATDLVGDDLDTDPCAAYAGRRCRLSPSAPSREPTASAIAASTWALNNRGVARCGRTRHSASRLVDVGRCRTTFGLLTDGADIDRAHEHVRRPRVRETFCSVASSEFLVERWTEVELRSGPTTWVRDTTSPRVPVLIRREQPRASTPAEPRGSRD